MRSSRPEGYRIIIEDGDTYGLWLKSSDKGIKIGDKDEVAFNIDPTTAAPVTQGNKNEKLTIKLREVDYCKDGDKYKMLVLCSEYYEE
jgi:hypothetical protein